MSSKPKPISLNEAICRVKEAKIILYALCEHFSGRVGNMTLPLNVPPRISCLLKNAVFEAFFEYCFHNAANYASNLNFDFVQELEKRVVQFCGRLDYLHREVLDTVSGIVLNDPRIQGIDSDAANEIDNQINDFTNRYLGNWAFTGSETDIFWKDKGDITFSLSKKILQRAPSIDERTGLTHCAKWFTRGLDDNLICSFISNRSYLKPLLKKIGSGYQTLYQDDIDVPDCENPKKSVTYHFGLSSLIWQFTAAKLVNKYDQSVDDKASDALDKFLNSVHLFNLGCQRCQNDSIYTGLGWIYKMIDFILCRRRLDQQND